jgi:hypothetical protein
MLAMLALYYLSQTSSLLFFIYLFFCFGDFGDGVLLLAGAGLDHESSIYAFHSSWDDRCTPSHPVFSVENASHECFAQAGLQTKISAS